MKKTLVFIFLVMVISSFLGLCACNYDNNNIPPIIEKHDIYLDAPEGVFENVSQKYSFAETIVSTNSNNKNLRINLTLTNLDIKSKTITIINPTILQEETNIKYNVSVLFGNTVELPYGIDKTIYFSVVIPESYKNVNYVLNFVMGDTFNFYLYETPDELRKDCIVKYTVQDKIVETLTVKERRVLDSSYVWENSNHLHYCDKWYTNKELTIEFKKTDKVLEDIVLYGREISNVKSTYDSSGRYITGINYVHSDGILVVPENPMEDKVYLSNFAIKDNSAVREIYLPKTLKKIYYGNFENMPNLTKIHFAGTQNEWENIPTSSEIDESVVIVYDSSF